MKFAMFMLNVICCVISLHAQTSNAEQKQLLLSEIKSYNHIESYCQGIACNSYSILYKKADSLLSLSTIDETMQYFDESSYTLKYYTFTHLLDINDTIAFELLARTITDTTLVNCAFADASFSIKFNYLLIYEYSDAISSKRRHGA